MLDDANSSLCDLRSKLLSASTKIEIERARYRGLFSLFSDGYMVTTGPRGRINEANAVASKLLNIPAPQLAQKSLTLLVHRSDRPLLAQAMKRMLEIDRGEWTFRLVPRNAPLLIVRATAHAVRRWGGGLEKIRWVLRDVTAEQSARRALNASRNRLRAMAAKLSLAEEQERRRIATDIHDHISQSLAVAKLRLGLLRGALPPEQASALDELRDLLGNVIADTRTLTFELSPAILYELGLGSAIEWLIEQRSGCGVKIPLRNDAPRLELRIETAVTLFQIARELLTNIVKHAKATEAVIRLSRVRRSVVLQVCDNGIGFGRRGDGEKPGTRNFGLFSVQERVGHLGGRTRIHSTDHSGTSIRVVIPLAVQNTRHFNKERGPNATQRAHRGRSPDTSARSEVASGKGSGPEDHRRGRQRPGDDRGGRNGGN